MWSREEHAIAVAQETGEVPHVTADRPVHATHSPRTVHSHIEHLLRKTGAASLAEATALAVRDGLLRPAPDHLAFFVER